MNYKRRILIPVLAFILALTTGCGMIRRKEMLVYDKESSSKTTDKKPRYSKKGRKAYRVSS